MKANVKNHQSAVGWVGIIAVVAFIVMWIACYTAESSWVWDADTLGTFGILENSENYFNYGIIIVGVLISTYGIGKACGGMYPGYAVSGNLMIIGGILIALMGIITADVQDGDYQKLVTVLGAFFIIAGLIASAVQNHYNGMIIPVGAAIIFFILMVFAYVQYGYIGGQIYFVILLAAWIVLDAAVMVSSGIIGAEKQ